MKIDFFNLVYHTGKLEVKEGGFYKISREQIVYYEAMRPVLVLPPIEFYETTRSTFWDKIAKQFGKILIGYHLHNRCVSTSYTDCFCIHKYVTL